MNYESYAAKISSKFIRNHEESERILKHLFKLISDDLSQDKRVYFRNFGSFKKVTRPARKYRNFKTNHIETRPPKKDIHFSPSPNLTKKLH